MIEVEIWKSSTRKEEIHHYYEDAYLFGMSSEILGKKFYKKILGLVKKQLKDVLHKS